MAAVILVLDKGLPELIAFLRNNHIAREQKDVSGAGGGIAAAFGGGFGSLLAAVLVALRTTRSVKGLAADVKWFQKLGRGAQRAVAHIAAWLVGPLILAGGFVLSLLMLVSTRHITWWIVVLVGLLFLTFWFFGDVTSWSLHPYYRRRLCTAFALKRVSRYPGDTFGQALERCYSRLVPLSKSGLEPGTGTAIKTWPTLLVCAAANVSDQGATPPGREVTSFTFSPIAMGGPLVGGVPTRAFEDRIVPRRLHDFTLAAAVAMSGAAISPSMGKETRRSFRLLLALANIRLGVWVPNPRRVDRWLETPHGLRQFVDRHTPGELARGRVNVPLTVNASGEITQFRRRVWIPRPGPKYLVKEMMGWNSVNDPYLYVTDGGHYENLGVGGQGVSGG